VFVCSLLLLCVFEFQRVACGSEDLTQCTMSTGSLIAILVRHVAMGGSGGGFEEFILLQLLVEPDQSNMVFQLSMVN